MKLTTFGVLSFLGCVSIAWMKRCPIVLNDEIERVEDYDPRSQVCCGGSIHHRHSNKGEERGCCNGIKLYRKLDQICCDGNVTDRFNGVKEQKCCGNKSYLVDSVEKHTQCCGNQFISTKHGCCNGRTPFNKTTSACEEDREVVPLGHGFCGGILFDRRKQKCCDRSTLYNESSFDRHFECCGKSLFDNRTKQCCEWAGKAKVQPTNGQCCGTGLYNTANGICCRNNVFASNGTIQCCRNSSYDERKQVCCRGTVHDKTNMNNPKCCGTNVYSTTSHLCCRGHKIINKNASDHDKCCPQKSEFFSCKKHPGGTPSNVCGRQLYDPQRDLCCNNHIHKGARETGRKCCQSGTRDYDPKNETCCYNVVKRNTESCNEQSDTPSPATPNSRQPKTSGICRISSAEWTPQKMRKSVNNGELDICRRNAYMMKVQSMICYNSTKNLQSWMVLRVTAKRNFYNATDTLNKKKTINVYLPCSCKKHTTRKGEKILLVTDIKLPLKTIHLGDSDVILPYKKKVLNDVMKRSKFCYHQVIRNIYLILTQTSIK